MVHSQSPSYGDGLLYNDKLIKKYIRTATERYLERMSSSNFLSSSAIRTVSFKRFSAFPRSTRYIIRRLVPEAKSFDSQMSVLFVKWTLKLCDWSNPLSDVRNSKNFSLTQKTPTLEYLFSGIKKEYCLYKDRLNTHCYHGHSLLGSTRISLSV